MLMQDNESLNDFFQKGSNLTDRQSAFFFNLVIE